MSPRVMLNGYGSDVLKLLCIRNDLSRPSNLRVSTMNRAVALLPFFRPPRSVNAFHLWMFFPFLGFLSNGNVLNRIC